MNEVPLNQDFNYWIGLTDSAVEGHFIWHHSSKPLSWSNWNKGEPNNSGPGDEDCVVLLNEHHSRYWQWDDQICSRDNSYNGDMHALCEYW